MVDARESTMAGLLREARAYPDGVVATPHYLASRGRARRCSPTAATRSTPRSPPTSCSASSRRTCAASAATCSRWCGTAHVHAYRGRRPRAGGRDASTRVRDAVGRRRRCRRSVRTRSRCPARSTAGSRCSSSAGRARSASSRSRRCATPSDGFPLTQRGAVVLHAHAALLYEHFGLPDFRDGVRRRRAGRLGPPTRARAHDPHARRRRSRRVLPRPDRRRDRASAAGAGGFMTAADLAAHTGAWVEPLRAPFARRRDPRDAAADAGRHRARGAAHRRRPRPRRRRPRPRSTC